MQRLRGKNLLLVGFTLFSMCFGAGNLIFPPMLGLQSGSNWLSGMIGMLASGVGLPILAIIVLGMCGSVQKISDHVNKKFYTVMIGAIMILCCCVSIPRTAAVWNRSRADRKVPDIWRRNCGNMWKEPCRKKRGRTSISCTVPTRRMRWAETC